MKHSISVHRLRHSITAGFRELIYTSLVGISALKTESRHYVALASATKRVVSVNVR